MLVPDPVCGMFQMRRIFKASPKSGGIDGDLKGYVEDGDAGYGETRTVMFERSLLAVTIPTPTS